MKQIALLMLILTVFSAFAEEVKETTSFSDLIENPKKFDEQKVILVGYLRMEFEEEALYLDKKDFEKRETRRAIWVNTTETMRKNYKSINEKQVIIEGTLNAKSRGHMAAFSANLIEVTRCEPWPVASKETKSEPDHSANSASLRGR